MNPPRHHNGVLGQAGEEAAVHYVTGLGWRIVERNWRCSGGELDIVAHDGTEHVVVEVKTRQSTRFGTPAEAITPAKADRLWRLARRWAAARGARGDRLRVDVLGLVADGDGGFTVDHVRAVSR